MIRFFVYTFGCQMNAADSEEMTRPLLEKGFQVTEDRDSSDAILINTCTVRQHAEDKAISLIGYLRKWKAENPSRFLIVAGCAAERTKGWLQKKFPHVDLVVGAKSIDQYPQILEEALRSRFNWAKENKDIWENPNGLRTSDLELRTTSFTSYVTIMRGCNYSCTYCIVPQVRGREIYRPIENILNEVKAKAAQGTKEIMLLGQTVNGYRFEDVDFADLLRLVNAVEGLERIRFMSPHPYYLTPRMIAAMAECRKVCEDLHLPVQSGSDRILKRMKRNYTRKMYLERISALRSQLSNLSLTTDFIVGFPGETQQDFQETLSLLEEADFDSAFCFKFSPRQGTEAASMPDLLPESLIEERHQKLLGLVEEKARRKSSTLVGE
ncbi:MAG: tRNA (N6-isopentenyl adenosine(37)-C2)-methylthiotransferase MiaB [Elusimicrobia bacterium]|nr:tRNA (N6-isopentenyl adenosine(37)-C2)-methylthiotransferase MiaB [Elusimicrobiota bacterium]